MLAKAGRSGWRGRRGEKLMTKSESSRSSLVARSPAYLILHTCCISFDKGVRAGCLREFRSKTRFLLSFQPSSRHRPPGLNGALSLLSCSLMALEVLSYTTGTLYDVLSLLLLAPSVEWAREARGHWVVSFPLTKERRSHVSRTHFSRGRRTRYS